MNLSDPIVTKITPAEAALEWSTYLAGNYSFPNKQFKLNGALVPAGPVAVDISSLLIGPMSTTHDSPNFDVFTTIETAIASTAGVWFAPTATLLATLSWTLNNVIVPVSLPTTIQNANFSSQGLSPPESFTKVFHDWMYTIEWSGVHASTGIPFTANLF